MKKVNFSNKSDIRLGFEVECVVKNVRKNVSLPGNFPRHVNTGQYKKFQTEIKALPHKVQFGYDGSIECQDYYELPVELRTPPLHPKDAMILLKSVFDIVNKYGYTNNSCGFHVNISSSHKAKMRDFNPLPFLSSKLWHEILAEFKRGGNSYCRPVIRNSQKKIPKIRLLNNMLSRGAEKYRCVNLRNFGNGQGKRSRVEIRGFGNKDYSNKFDTISEYIKRIERLFKLCCSTFSETRVPNV